MEEKIGELYVELRAKGAEDLSKAFDGVRADGDKAAKQLRDGFGDALSNLTPMAAAQERFNAGIERGIARLNDLDVALEPENLQATVALQLQLRDAHAAVAAAVQAETEAQTGLTAAQSRWAAGLESVKDRAAQIATAMEPSNLAQYTAATLGLETAQQQLADATEREREAQTGLNAAQRGAQEQLGSLEKQLAGVNAQMEPGVLQRRVALTRQLEEATKRQKEAEAKERERQEGPQPEKKRGFLEQLGEAGRSFGGRVGGFMRALGGLAPAEGAEGVGGGLTGGGGFVALAGPVGALAGAATMAANALMEVAAWGLKVVSLAMPGVVERLSMAFEDAQAVIGQRLVPVVELVTEGVRAFGDFLANALPDTGEIRAMVNELRPAFEDIKSAFTDLAPLIKTGFTLAVETLSAGLKALALVVRPVAKAFELVSGLWLVRAAGAALGEGEPNRSSVGAAARPAQQYGDINAAIEAMNIAALSGQGNIQESQLEHLSSMDSALGTIAKAVEKIAGSLGAGKELADKYGEGGKRAADAYLGTNPLTGLLWGALRGIDLLNG